MPDPFFRIEMLPATYGDCLWIEYGPGDKTHRVLIDGGPVGTYAFLSQRIEKMPPGARTFELIVLTHVDADHIEGLVRLFADKPLPFVVKKVWFNGWRQMNKAQGMLGALDGEFLTALLARRVPGDAWEPGVEPIVIPKDGPLPRVPLPGGMVITLLSPTVPKLKRMAKKWKEVVEENGMTPGDLEAAWALLAEKKKYLPGEGLLGKAPDLDALLQKQFIKDQAAPNGSSIGFLAEYGKKSALFLADTHPDVVAASIKRLCAERGTERLSVGAVKVSHHGSKANTSAALLRLIDSPKWLISTNGDKNEHPDRECMARIIDIAKPREFYFNYESAFTKPWIDKAAQEKFQYEAVVRPEDALTIEVPL